MPNQTSSETGPITPSGPIPLATLSNEIQGHGISFCADCGREFIPQETRRGHLKRFCTPSCRAKAWRRGRKAAHEAAAP